MNETSLTTVKTPEIMEWTLDNGEMLRVTLEDARNISGNEHVTPKEFYMLCQICKPAKLNPFLGDAFLVKFGTKPAQIITGKNSAVKIASRNKLYKGYKAGIIVLDKNKKVVHREGAMVYEGEQLVGGWGKVFRHGWDEPAYDEVSMKEYVQKKSDGQVNSKWRTQPATMIRKVALVHALREAFPEDLNGVYDESELAAIQKNQEGKKQSTKSQINNIFGYKDDDIIEVETEEVTQDNPDILLNELLIYVKALKLTDEKINELFEKHNVSSWKELTDEVKQKCIDRLKPKYEALKQEPNKTEEAIQQAFDLPAEDDPFNDEYREK